MTSMSPTHNKAAEAQNLSVPFKTDASVIRRMDENDISYKI